MTEISAIPWSTILATAVSALAILYLRSIKQCLLALVNRIDRQDDQIAKSQDDLTDLTRKFSDCKVDCERNTVSKEDWVRSEGINGKKLDDVNNALHRIEGQLQVTNKLPEICGQIAREISATQKQESGGPSHAQ